MKAKHYQLISKLLFAMGILYAISVFITKEVVFIVALFIAFSVVKFLLKTAISLLFILAKWITIFGLIALLILSSIK